MNHRYQSCYCEENIYLLCEDLFKENSAIKSDVLFITNVMRSCALNNQKAVLPGGTVFWDYHVVLMRDRNIYDFDSRLPFPCPASFYISRTFDPDILFIHRPLFNLIPAEIFLDTFSSDRSHMKRPDGSWQKIPPPWPLITGKKAQSSHELPRFLDCQDQGIGRILSLDDMYKLLNIR